MRWAPVPGVVGADGGFGGVRGGSPPRAATGLGSCCSRLGCWVAWRSFTGFRSRPAATLPGQSVTAVSTPRLHEDPCARVRPARRSPVRPRRAGACLGGGIAPRLGDEQRLAVVTRQRDERRISLYRTAPSLLSPLGGVSSRVELLSNRHRTWVASARPRGQQQEKPRVRARDDFVALGRGELDEEPTAA
jgi:hypothetical protein